MHDEESLLFSMGCTALFLALVVMFFMIVVVSLVIFE